MGRIKTQLVKRIAIKLFKENPETFKKDFSENKKLLEGVIEVNSKKLRNIIAGYLTRLVKQQAVKK
jgi:small subunit ribosomal protein S17e